MKSNQTKPPHFKPKLSSFNHLSQFSNPGTLSKPKRRYRRIKRIRPRERLTARKPWWQTCWRKAGTPLEPWTAWALARTAGVLLPPDPAQAGDQRQDRCQTLGAGVWGQGPPTEKQEAKELRMTLREPFKLGDKWTWIRPHILWIRPHFLLH